ncbi:MAG: MOSC domain-containing protein [Gammaproteobacteria bacterium]|nr:MOSC domain-containing protein [Gammaproteobacteria bacterium]
MLTVDELKSHFPSHGKIEWIGLRKPEDRIILTVSCAELLLDHGLVGDKSGLRGGGKRQVSLIQAEYLPVIASFLNRVSISPQELRRNIVVSGINLGILKGHTLKLKDAELKITGNCAPCKKMEQVLGYGGFNAMRNHGGVTALVKKGGVIRVGDEVEVLMEDATHARLI